MNQTNKQEEKVTLVRLSAYIQILVVNESVTPRPTMKKKKKKKKHLFSTNTHYIAHELK